MGLRGKQPDDRVKRLKLLLSGPAGVGKTTAAIKMPKCYVIDCERGSVHYGDIIKASGGAVFEPVDMHDIITEVRSLMTEKHDFLTVVVDPITTVYHALGDEGERKMGGTEFAKNYKLYADKFMRRLMALLSMIDMNVIMTAHTKNLWGKDSKGEPTIIGQTFDGYTKLDYMFDLYLQLEKEPNSKRFATVTKTRLSAEFPDMDRFEWSYQELVKRFGKDRIEKGSESVALATSEQINRFRFLLNEIGEDGQKSLKIDKAMAGVEDIADLPVERITRGIEVMEKHLAARSAL